MDGNRKTIEEFENLILAKGPDGGLIRLKDVGKAEYGFQSFYSSAINAISGHSCVGFGGLLVSEAMCQIAYIRRGTPGAPIWRFRS